MVFVFGKALGRGGLEWVVRGTANKICIVFVRKTKGWDCQGMGLCSGRVLYAYKETSEEEKSVVNGHCNHLALKFSVCVKERQDRLPTMYWLPKLHKKRKKHDLLQTQVLVLQLNFLKY